METEQVTADDGSSKDSYPMDKLLAKLSEQQATLNHPNAAAKPGAISYTSFLEHENSSSSLPITPAADGFPTTAPATRPASATIDEGRLDVNEVLRLKLQLAQAQNQISKLDQELAQSRTSEPESTASGSGAGRRSTPASRDGPWPVADDSQSDTSDSMSASAFSRARGIWAQPKGSFMAPAAQPAVGEPLHGTWLGGRTTQSSYPDSGGQFPGSDGPRERPAHDPDIMNRHGGNRRGNRYDNRGPPTAFVGAYGPGGNQFDSMAGPAGGPAVNMHHPQAAPGVVMYPQYQQQTVGTALSPHASEFTSKAGWKNEVCSHQNQFVISRLKIWYLDDSCRRTYVFASHGASQLPSPTRSQRQLQLEVHR